LEELGANCGFNVYLGTSVQEAWLSAIT